MMSKGHLSDDHSKISTSLSTTLEETLLQKVCASPFYSIVLDESTESTVKQLGVVVHYIDIETAVLPVSYLKLLDMTKAIHVDAAALESAVTIKVSCWCQRTYKVSCRNPKTF